MGTSGVAGNNSIERFWCGADGCTGAELRGAGSQTGRDPRTENAKAQQCQGRKHERHGIVERGLIAAKTLRELAEQGGADADDDGKHEHLDARRNDVPQHALGEEGRLVEQAKRDEHKAGKGRELKFDQRDEQLHRQDEEGNEHDEPGDQQHEYLNEVLEERDEAHQLAGGVQDRLPSIDPDLRDPAGLNELVGR